MSIVALALLSLLQSAPRVEPPALAARLVVHPAHHTVVAGDTLRLRVEALDAAGRPLPLRAYRFSPAGAFFEATVTPEGLVTAGSPGVLPVGVVVIPERGEPLTARVEIRMVPGPAATVRVDRDSVRLAPGQRVGLSARSFSARGEERADPVAWRSSAPRVATVDGAGRVTALAPGRATLTATAGAAASSVAVQVLSTRVASVRLLPDRADARRGEVIRFRATALDAAGRPIAGLAPSYSFAPGDGAIDAEGAFVGYLPGEYRVTASYGERGADALVRVEPRAAERRVTVVGRLPRSAYATEELWLHPTAPVAYLGTGDGGDRLYAIDISDPARPVVVDSLLSDTRRVNDLMTTPDGRFLVHTREGASSRRNGIVIASLEDPLHPVAIAEFTEGLTAGVHSAFVHQAPDGPPYVYLTNDGTGAMHVVDLSDPTRPREVARWSTPGSLAGRSLHDVEVKDGLAYLSYWNEGLVILDVGNGVKGGSPSSPRFVSQYRYDLDALYARVGAVGGAGFIRGTHTAWRHGDYVFIADEVFPASPPEGAADAAALSAYGRLHVIDVRELESPREVAWYEPEKGGVHNLWVEGDRLYLGAYDGGFRALDVSGELRGDLGAQGRVVATLHTGDLGGRYPNVAMTWGAIARDGLVYVNDNVSGLWILRIEDPAGSSHRPPATPGGGSPRADPHPR